ncbi:MAG: hypothetical protein GX295_11995 [Syntrophomonadaceae bacterium]|nr:hypothetical protein [Syntrophomonadaceae bacterium]
MAKIISMQPPTSKRLKMKYMITIDEDEITAYVARELKPGVITIMITAKSPEEADLLRKESTAIAIQGHRVTAIGGTGR